MLYYRAVIPLGDDHGYTLHYYTIHVTLKSGRPRGHPREIHCGGMTGQAETIRDGPGPGRVRGYLTIIRYRVLGI